MSLLPKKTRGGKVTAQMTLRFGNEKSLTNLKTISGMTGSMLMRGTTKHTRQQLQDELDRLKARVFVGGPLWARIVSIETVRENLPAVMTLVAEILREPSFPAKEFEQLRRETLAAIEQDRSEPVQLAYTAFGRHLGQHRKGDPYYVMTVDELIAEHSAVTLEQVKQFYRDFHGAQM